ncbi:uncharacterized protein LOC124150886 [Haliotis rufescens]|uniref:uncharacterized protein LOC124150886 n=1 Tax=Haliotis rufescens TaxID=6454 RepID=UPI00201F8F88|nr:uncharacterized protein LOC124150886 [Haliotis rufescens]XP_046379029.2 uncharacterized protein LOC124150886 [Haliotis rufescens]
MASKANKDQDPCVAQSKRHQPGVDPPQIDVTEQVTPCCEVGHCDAERLRDGAESEDVDSCAAKHTAGRKDEHGETHEDPGRKDHTHEAQEEEVDECGEMCSQIQIDQQQNELEGEADLSQETDNVHRRSVKQSVLRDGDGFLRHATGDDSGPGELPSPHASCSDMKEVKELLTVVLSVQNVLLEETRMLKDAHRKNAVTMNEALESHKSDCRTYTDNQVRSLDCRLHGLSAVLDHVQTRCMEAELARETHRQSETLSSSDALDDDNVGAKAGLPDKLHQVKNRSWLRQNHLMLINNLDLKNGLLIDKLVQDDVLFQSDEETIRSHSTRKCQVRELVSRINRCDSDQFLKFKNHLSSEYPHLECLSSAEDKEKKKFREKCVVCNLTKIVDVHDIVDHMYQQKCIDSCTYETIWRRDVSQAGWCRLLKGVTRSDSKCTEALVAALSRKYPELAQRVACAQGDVLTCCCSKIKKEH